jgi:hypothetical protein
VRVVCAAAVAGVLGCCLVSCGSAGGTEPEPPFSKIGFVGALTPGVGFVGGGRGHHDAGPYPHDGGASGGGDSGMAGGSSSGGGSSGSGSGAGSNGGSGDGGDGGSSVGVIIMITPGFFAYLDWSISGPAGMYSGRASFGAAQSIEFVVGGIQEGDGYLLTLQGTDPSGDPCIGTSSPFSVAAGGTTGVAVTIECFTGDGGPLPANIMTGNVAVDAGVAQH